MDIDLEVEDQAHSLVVGSNLREGHQWEAGTGLMEGPQSAVHTDLERAAPEKEDMDLGEVHRNLAADADFVQVHQVSDIAVDTDLQEGDSTPDSEKN